MSTRGIWGFFDGKKFKLTYCSSDAYPSGLGQRLQEMVVDNHEVLRDVYERLDLRRDTEPTRDEIEACMKLMEKVPGDTAALRGLSPAEQWSCLLREIGRDPRFYSDPEFCLAFDASPEMNAEFIQWKYIVDLHYQEFEIHKHINAHIWEVMTLPLSELPIDMSIVDGILQNEESQMKTNLSIVG